MKIIRCRLAGYHVWLSAIAVLSIYLFFFQQFNSGFAVIFSNAGDGVIEAVLVSHWYHVLNLTAAWNEPAYLYPAADTLGYNDGYFLYGLIAAFYRLLGCNLLLAQELMHVTVKSIGFFSMAALLNRLQGRRLINLLGAMLFTLWLSSSVQGGHGQLFEVAFAPLLTLLLLQMVSAISEGSARRSLSWGIGFAVLYDSLLLTGYYMAWFYGLFLILYIPFLLMFEFRQGWMLLRAAKRVWIQLAITGLVFVLAAGPFMRVYLPTLHQTGGQGYIAQLFYSLQPQDIINIGSGSLLYGWLFQAFSGYFPGVFQPGEWAVGFTPDILVLLLLILAGLAAGKAQAYPGWWRALGLTTLLAMALPISMSGYCLWHIINWIIPGANGLRCIVRFYIFLSFPVTVLILVYLGGWQLRLTQARWLVPAILILICLGQIDRHPPVGLNVAKEMSIVQGAAAPGPGCRSFFVSDPADPPVTFMDRLYRQNVQAMLLADDVGIPTLNGFASFNPPDWIFNQDAMYPLRVEEYILNHDLDGVCHYDLATRQWSGVQVATLDDLPAMPPGLPIRFMNGGNSTNMTVQGFSMPEKLGSWTDQDKAEMFLKLNAVPAAGLKLMFDSSAFVIPAHPFLQVTVLINGQKLPPFIYNYPDGAQEQVRMVDIPADAHIAAGQPIKLAFEMQAPASPHDMGVGGDMRALGIFMRWLTVAPQGAASVLAGP